MKLEELKDIVENKQYSGQFIIFHYSDNKFIPHQYIEKISRDMNLEIQYEYEITNSILSGSDLFSINTTTNYLRIYDVDTLDFYDKNLVNEKKLFIICKKIEDSIKSYLSSCIVTVPKLEDWQIKDFVYSVGEGVSQDNLDRLINICSGNIYRLESELQKIQLFDPISRENLFQDFLKDGVFNDLSDATIFDLIDSLLKHDITKFVSVYSQIESMDVNPLGVVSLLYQNIKNIIKIQTQKNVTPESINIQKNKFYAIKYNYVGKFSSKSLIDIFIFLTDIDRRLKIGELDVDDILDYVIVYLFSKR